MATIHRIKSSVNDYEQDVTPGQLETLKKNGWKGRILKTTDTSKSAKTPEEVKEAKK